MNQKTINIFFYKKLLLIILIPFVISIKYLTKLNLDNEIFAIFIGKNKYQSILQSAIDNPSEVIINGNTQTTIGKSYLLTEPENEIIIKWSSPLTNCEGICLIKILN